MSDDVTCNMSNDFVYVSQVAISHTRLRKSDDPSDDKKKQENNTPIILD